MTKEKKKTMTPKVRFPEFREAWTTKDLGEIAVLIDDKAGSNSYKLMSITAGVGLVSQIEKFGREIAGESYKNYCVIRKGDFAYNKSSTKQHPEGQIAMLEDEEIAAVPNSIFTCFRVDDKIVSPFFLKYPFSNNIHGDWLRKFIEVGARAHGALSVDSKDLFATPIPFPSLPEQQKIAATLTSLDDLISAQSEKIKALQAHKKGLMQQLFPAEGERTPRVRFGEFKGDGEWEEKTLGKVAIFLKGKGISKSDITPEGLLPCIRYGELYTHYGETINQVVSYTNLPKDGLLLSQANDVIIPASGETKEDIATASCVIKSGIALGGDLNVIRTKINGVFLSYYLNNAKKQEIAKLAQGISVVHLYPGQLQKLKINVPKEDEQQKIASLLTSLDDLITTQHEKLEVLKTHKKGLMQQLFPNPNEEAI